MRTRTSATLFAILLPVAFLAGWLAGPGGGRGGGERKVLYWVDPMNPSFRSAEPGTAPCGMPLEPVYEDAGTAGAGARAAATAPGTVLCALTASN